MSKPARDEGSTTSSASALPVEPAWNDADTGYEHLGLESEPGDTPVHAQWGSNPVDHFGYSSDEERLARRGMEDWELVTKIPASQRRVPYWFLAVVVIVLLIAVGLGFPFWGQRPGHKVEWFNWGFVAAIFYVAGAGTFVYFMTNLYGSERAGRLDSDPQSASYRPGPDGNPADKRK
jgi:hypothetical protein